MGYFPARSRVGGLVEIDLIPPQPTGTTAYRHHSHPARHPPVNDSVV